MALFRSGVEALGRAPELMRAAPVTLPTWVVIGSWLLEAVALSALYLLVQTGGGGRLMNGLVTGWIAWVFRGPLLVIAVVTLAGQPAGPWWNMAFSWWTLRSVGSPLGETDTSLRAVGSPLGETDTSLRAEAAIRAVVAFPARRRAGRPRRQPGPA